MTWARSVANVSDAEALAQRASAALASGAVLSDRRERTLDTETIGIAFEIRRRADGLYEKLATRWCGKPGGPQARDEEREARGESELKVWLQVSTGWLTRALERVGR